MRGDFSRDSFNVGAGFSRVLQQQGRVQLDADVNESQAILLHQLRSLARTLIGPHGGRGGGFEIQALDRDELAWDFQIDAGEYYVDGWLCSNPATFAWRGDESDEKFPRQPFLTEQPQPKAGQYVVYLDVWERHLSAAEHDWALAGNDPGSLREIALGGVDTAGRAQLIWQVRIRPYERQTSAARSRRAPAAEAAAAPAAEAAAAAAGVALPGRLDLAEDEMTSAMTDKTWNALIAKWHSPRRGSMAARCKTPATDSNPCVVSPRSSYRGVENHLYRIEICRGGSVESDKPAFIWSRDNGSVTLSLDRASDDKLWLAEGWRDARSAISAGDHVEISDEAVRLEPGPGPIRRVTGYDPDDGILTLDEPVGDELGDRGLVVRRWDHVRRDEKTGVPPLKDRALVLTEGEWLTIEDGIQIRFEPSDKTPNVYREGDYWLIPARVDLGDVVWPHGQGRDRMPLAIPPHGVERSYAPLALVTFENDGTAGDVVDLRRTIGKTFQSTS